jgi:hypothetical protein
MTGMDSVDPHRDDDDATSCVIVWLNAQQQQQQQQQQRQLQQQQQQQRQLQQQQQQQEKKIRRKQQQQQQQHQGGSAGEQGKGHASEQQQQAQPGELEQSLFGLWGLLTAVQPGDGSACYLPSQHAVHGTSYPRHAAQHTAEVVRTLRGCLKDAPQPPPPAAAVAAGQPRLQRYGIALVSKRRDVMRVLGQWHEAVAAAANSSLSHDAKRQQLKEQLTWLCPDYSHKLLGMHCSVPACVQLWAPLLLACGGAGCSEGDAEQQPQ